MLLEIGRNSNFAKADMEALRHMDDQSDIVIYSLYDFYHVEKSCGLKEKGKWAAACRTISQIEHAGFTVLLLPVGLDERGVAESNCGTVADTAVLAAEQTENMLRVYLPEIPEGYGLKRTGGDEAASEDSKLPHQVLGRLMCADVQPILEEAAEKIAEAIEKKEAGSLFLEKETNQRNN
ncbi:hypothetical protein [Bacillus sp. B-jedd]|uniref:hypothetical protein n=1 Tax=Bacillus sp. B-jedd TaxID=1476857 RepID=UPI0005156A2F|nr:hypothetical protein [Bacillus sp. B-jedd]CEG26093.1 hypothetical protein BN1002_00932 [Bacillus sp. B-jedd]